MNFWIRGSLGDIVYSLPTVIAFGGGNLYTKTEWNYQALHRLLGLQSYIHKFNSYINTNPITWKHENDQPNPGMAWNDFIDANLDRMRAETKKYQHKKHLSQCFLDVFQLKYDLSQPWIENIKPKHQADIIINRTNRYHDKNKINWSSLTFCQNRCAFVGYEKEWKNFTNQTGLTVKYYPTKDLYHIAQIIRGSSLFIGNQSSAFALAEAMKHPRVLEVCYNKNNCQPQSNNGYTILNHDLIESHLSGN